MTTLNIEAPVSIPNNTFVLGMVSTNDSFEIASNLPDTADTANIAKNFQTLGADGSALAITKAVSPANPEKLMIGVGLGADPGLEDLRRAAGEAVRAAAGQDSVTLAIAHETIAELEALVEGALLGAYAFTSYREAKKAPVETITVLSVVEEDAAAVAERAAIIADAVNRIRDLTNTAPNDLNPAGLAAIAEAEGTDAGCTVKIYEGDDLKKEKLAGLINVGKGSASEPKLVRVEWAPDNAKGFTALVGKGITFDTGGYSLKPSNSMTEMKTDMAGAATVLQTVIAVARLQLPVKVVAWMALAENMVSGLAQRPDDVITYRNGKSVEVNNTDAEGRLVLADGLLMATEEQPDEVLDIATLTGAQMVALGNRFTGIMGTETTREAVVTAADAAGEEAWGMPLPSHLRESLDSDIADMRNSGTRWGGMLVAGLFLKEFVGETPWAHIDIAGPSFNREGAYGYTPKGATGCMLRTLLTFIEQKAA